MKTRRYHPLNELKDLIPGHNAIFAVNLPSEESIASKQSINTTSLSCLAATKRNFILTDSHTEKPQTSLNHMKVGKLVWIRRRDYDDFSGAVKEFTVGRGIITALTTSFAKVYGKDGDYVFDEWFPFESSRLWMIAA